MKTTLLCAVLLVGVAGNSQQLYMEWGTTVSAFDYSDSTGQTLDNLQSKTGTAMRMGYRDVLNHNQTLFLRIGGIYNEYGAIGSDRVLDNFFEWEVSYLGLETGLDYRLFRLRDFSFYLKGSVAAEFLIQGTQTINNQVFNLAGEDEFNSYNFFLRGGLMMTYPISRNTLVTAGYNYGVTTQISNNDNEETLNFKAHQFGFGLIINLPNCNCPF